MTHNSTTLASERRAYPVDRMNDASYEYLDQYAELKSVIKYKKGDTLVVNADGVGGCDSQLTATTAITCIY